jgi:hypothetical protein
VAAEREVTIEDGDLSRRCDELARLTWPQASKSWRTRLMRLILECFTFQGQNEQTALDALEAALRVMACR